MIRVDEFSGAFAITPARGTRSFDVDGNGRLRGVSYSQVWTPEENLAWCMASDTLSEAIARAFQPMTHRHAAPTPKPLDREGHTVAACTCGFYAYYEGSDDYARPDRISGVVDGYGDVVIGTRGFRASKARLCALYLPLETATASPASGEAPLPGRVFDMVRANYPHVPIFHDLPAMLAAFPPDRGETPTPQNTPDFWTREA